MATSRGTHSPFAEERGHVAGDGVGLFLLVAEPQQPHRLALRDSPSTAISAFRWTLWAMRLSAAWRIRRVLR